MPILTEEQEDALNALLVELSLGRPVVVLTGPAGSGKTTLLQALLRHVAPRTVHLCAPTGKAAARMTEVLGRKAFTLHSLLYGEPEVDKVGAPVFNAPRPPCNPGDLLVCDEASMIDRYLFEHLTDAMPPGGQILFVGDAAQLPPVRGPWGVPLDGPTARLTGIHRQGAASPILFLGQHVRRGGALEAISFPDDVTVEDFGASLVRLEGTDGSRVWVHQRESWRAPAEWLVQRWSVGADAALLTYTNQSRRELGAVVREHLHGLGAPRLCPRDRLVIRANHYGYGYMNGEVYVVEAVDAVPGHPLEIEFGRLWTVRFVGHDRTIYVPDALLDPGGKLPAEADGLPLTFRSRVRDAQRNERPGADRLVHCEHGAVLTVHLCQGSQWPEVGFVWSAATARVWRTDPDLGRRLLYTAVTRAERELHLWLEG